MEKLQKDIDTYTERLKNMKQYRAEAGETFDDKESYHVDAQIIMVAEFIRILKSHQ